MNRWWRRRKQCFQFSASRLKRLAAKISISLHSRSKNTNEAGVCLREKIYPRCRRMQAQLQRVEVKFIVR